MNTTSVSVSAAIPVPDFQVFDAGDVLLQSGRTFRNMTVAYKTFGVLNDDKSNVIVYPTSYSAQHYDTQFMVLVLRSIRRSASSSFRICSETACRAHPPIRRGQMSDRVIPT